MKLLALLFVLALVSAPAVGLAQNGGGQVPAKDGDEVEAEAEGKKSGKLRVSDASLSMDLTGFPPGPLKDTKPDAKELRLLNKIKAHLPDLEKRMRAWLLKQPNLRDRIVYLTKRLNKLFERRDHIEAAAKKGFGNPRNLTAVDQARDEVNTLRTHYYGKYLDYLSDNFPEEAVDHLAKSYRARLRQFAEKLVKQVQERRKKMGLD